MNPKLTLALKSTDCGPYITGNTFEEYEVRADGKPVGTVMMKFGEYGEGTHFTVTMAEDAPYIFGELHMIANVTATITRAFTEDHEFYNEIFYNAEGEEIELPLFDILA